MAVKAPIPTRVVALAFTAIAGYYAIWGGEYSLFDLYRLQERQESEAQRLATARAEVDSLRIVVQKLESDNATIEAVARERFGMIRKGELLYRFVDVDSPAVGATAP
jgi:cell division protein FtsB